MTSRTRFRVPTALSATLALVAVVLGLSAAPAQAAGERYVDEVFTDVTVTKDVLYGTGIGQHGAESLYLDLYAPQGDTAVDRPAIVYAHGGYFSPQLGDRDSADSQVVATAFAKRGYVVVSISYRMWDGPLNDIGRLAKSIPAAMEDSQTAVRYLRAHAPEMGLDPDAIAIGGYSAGAITALNVANQGTNPVSPNSDSEAAYRHDVAAAFAFAGFASQVYSGAAPVVQFGGTADELIPYSVQELSCSSMVAAGDVCEFHGYPGATHVGLGVQYMVSDLIPKVAAFLKAHVVSKLGPPNRSPLGPFPGPIVSGPPTFGGPATTNRDGRLEVFGVNGDGDLFTIFQYAIGSGWSGFFPFPTSGGSKADGEVATQRNDDGRMQIAYRGVDGRVYTAGQRPGAPGWLPIEAVGQAGIAFASSPVFARNADGRFEIFGVAADGRLLHSFQDRVNGTFSDWYPLGTELLSTDPGGAIGLSVTDPEWQTIRLYATTASGGVLRYEQQAGAAGWGAPVDLGPTDAVGRPAGGATYFQFGGDGMVHSIELVAYRTAGDGHLESLSRIDDDAPTITAVGGEVSHNPVAGRNEDGRLEVFARGADGTIGHAYQSSVDGPFSAFTALSDAPCVTGPRLAVNDDGRLEVFCLGVDADLLHDFQVVPNGGWNGATSLGGMLVA